MSAHTDEELRRIADALTRIADRLEDVTNLPGRKRPVLRVSLMDEVAVSHP